MKSIINEIGILETKREYYLLRLEEVNALRESYPAEIQYQLDEAEAFYITQFTTNELKIVELYDKLSNINELYELINRKFLTMDDIKKLEQYPEVEITEDCGLSGLYPDYRYEVINVREGEELVEYKVYYR